MSSKETTRQGASESSPQMVPKAYFNEEGVFTVDFPHMEQTKRPNATRWTYTPSQGRCKIVHTREVQEYLCQLMRSLNRLPSGTLTSLHNPEGKVILVFKHDTLDSAFNTILQFLDVRNTVLTFLHNVQIPVLDMNVGVQHVEINQPTEQDVKGNKCIFDWVLNCSPPYKAESQWVCKTDSTNIVIEDGAHNSHFTRFKEDMCQRFRARLRRVSTGSVIFTFHHEHIKDALEMVSKHREVTAMVLECLQGIDSTVMDIQIQVQLQDFIATPTPARRDTGAEADLLDACRKGNLAEVKRILDTSRADVNCRGDVGGMTPVMEAAWWGHRDVVEFLVRQGADVSLVTDDGDNILHLACLRGDRETVEFVLSLDGVDVNARNNDGKTAADLARDERHHQLLDLLVSRSAQ